MTNEERIHRLLKVLPALLFLAAFVFAPETPGQPAKGEKKAYCYVACGDRRIYTIDIGRGQVVAVSDPIRELGNASCMDISRDGKTLYIGSERGHWQADYFPIVVVDVNTMKVKRKFHLEMDPPTGEFLGLFAVYGIRASPDGKTIFGGYAKPKYSGGSVVVDAETGEILRHLGFYVRQDQSFVFSEDGRYASDVEPEGVVTYDIQKGKKVAFEPSEELLASGRGLNPPWTRFESPLYDIDSDKYREGGEVHVRYTLKIVDRSTGRLLMERDTKEEQTGMGISKVAPFLVLHGDRYKVLLPLVGDVSEPGYVGILDIQTGKFEPPVPVGKVPTNVVCSLQLLSE